MKKTSFDLNLTDKRTVLNRSCSSFRALQREFGADTVKISTVFHWTEL